jgi:hypothetical protein
MCVRENQLVYFPGRISSSPFTDEFPPHAVPAFLCALAPSRETQILKILSILSKILNPAPLRDAQIPRRRNRTGRIPFSLK